MLAVDVWPALVNAIVSSMVQIPPTPAQAGTMPAIPIRGLSEGEQDSIPESPWAWLLNSRGDFGPFSSDKVKTDWSFTLRLLADWTNDSVNAEHILMPILEQVRQIFQTHLKLGTQTIVNSMVKTVDWGYVPVNSIWYRSADVQIEISEKEIRTAQV